MSEVAAVSLIPCSVLEFKLRTTSTSDKIVLDHIGGSDLIADGTINITAGTGFGAGLYDLITYTGTLTNNGFVLGTMPDGYTGTIVYNTDEKKIQLLVVLTLVADFTATPTTGNNPLYVEFSDTSVGNPISWSWDFGDGTTSVLQNPTHTYDNPGTYTVSLEVNSIDEQSSTSTKIDYITVNKSNRPQWVSGYPELCAVYDRKFDVCLKMDKDVRCYYVILPAGSKTPTSAQIIAGTDAYDVELNVKQQGSTVLTAYTEKRITVPYLIQETTYNIYFAAKP